MTKVFLGNIPIGYGASSGEIDPALMAQARTTLRRADRRTRALDRLQPLVDRLEDHLLEQAPRRSALWRQSSPYPHRG